MLRSVFLLQRLLTDSLPACPRRQSKILRNLDSTIPFELNQMKGACHHVEQMAMRGIFMAKGYGWMGIEEQWNEFQASAHHARIVLSDDFSRLLADLSMNVVMEHVRRNLSFSHGLPRRQVLILDGTEGPKFVQQFKRDWEIFQELEGMSFEGQEHLVKRSVFKLSSVTQLRLCLEDEGWHITPRPFPFAFSAPARSPRSGIWIRKVPQIEC